MCMYVYVCVNLCRYVYVCVCMCHSFEMQLELELSFAQLSRHAPGLQINHCSSEKIWHRGSQIENGEIKSTEFMGSTKDQHQRRVSPRREALQEGLTNSMKYSMKISVSER